MLIKLLIYIIYISITILIILEAGETRMLSLKNKQSFKPEWHAPWKLMRVISGHQGWVRSIAVDWSNQWFASGSNDRTIKIWDMASGQLKITLTGHINTVRGLEVSKKHAYLFSCGEDKTVRCWDLEYNKVLFILVLPQISIILKGY